MNSIPSLNSSATFGSPSTQLKSQNFNVSKLKILLTEEIMFDSEFDLTNLTKNLPKKELFQNPENSIWNFEEEISKMVAENALEERNKVIEK